MKNDIKIGNKKEKNLKFAKISKLSIDDVLHIGEELYYYLILNKKTLQEIETVSIFIIDYNK